MPQPSSPLQDVICAPRHQCEDWGGRDIVSGSSAAWRRPAATHFVRGEGRRLSQLECLP